MANNPNNFMVVQNSTDESQLLGKFLYYSLADVLVKKEDFERICNALNFPYAGRRISVVDAFKNATGKVMRRTDAGAGGRQEIFRTYCRDNMRDGNLYSRELVRETVGLRTNRYDKLANICYDRDTDRMYHDIVEDDPALDVEQLCRSMEQQVSCVPRVPGKEPDRHDPAALSGDAGRPADLGLWQAVFCPAG